MLNEVSCSSRQLGLDGGDLFPPPAGRNATEKTEELGACHSGTRVVPRTGIRTNIDIVKKKLKA